MICIINYPFEDKLIMNKEYISESDEYIQGEHHLIKLTIRGIEYGFNICRFIKK